jgi:hypothetical protein
MRVPRFPIASVMVAVAIAALDFGAIRTFLDPQSDAKGLVFGALPMANVLLVGLLTAPYRPRSRSYLLGFEAFGAIALALYILILAIGRGQEGPIDSYMEFVTIIVIYIIEPGHPLFVPILCSFAVIMLGGPQLVLALIGGSLSCRFKVTIPPRG